MNVLIKKKACTRADTHTHTYSRSYYERPDIHSFTKLFDTLHRTKLTHNTPHHTHRASHTQAHTNKQTHRHTHTHTNTQTHKHTHTHTHTHTHYNPLITKKHQWVVSDVINKFLAYFTTLCIVMYCNNLHCIVLCYIILQYIL